LMLEIIAVCAVRDEGSRFSIGQSMVEAGMDIEAVEATKAWFEDGQSGKGLGR